jgi:hypothetical protein
MLPDSIIQWLQHLWIANIIRNSAWMLPAIETTHLASYAAIFGAMITQTLRAFELGVRQSSTAEIRRQLRAWMVGGFVVSVITGALLFVYEPSRFGTNRVFTYKAGFIVTAAVFEFAIRGKLRASHAAEKRAAAASALVWLGVALSGLALSLT